MTSKLRHVGSDSLRKKSPPLNGVFFDLEAEALGAWNHAVRHVSRTQ
jgi:hypothetical protein